MSDRNEHVLFSALAETQKTFKREPARSVEVVQSHAEEVDFKNGKRKRRSWREKNIAEWSNSDLWYYFQASFYQRFNYAVTCPLMPGRQGLLKVGEEFRKVINAWPAPEVLKAYIDWFMSERLPDLLAKYSYFKINYVFHPRNIADFIESRGLKSVMSMQNAQSAPTKKRVVFEGSLVDFACEQGLLLLFAYFISQGKSENEASRLVATAISMTDKADRYSEFAAATRDNGPYPRELEFRNMDRILSKIAELSGRRVSLLRLSFEDDAASIEFRKET